jgi:hypothetical protein
MKISDFRLIKIRYDITIKEFDSMTDSFTQEEIEWATKISNDTINHTIKKRNNIVEWVWLTTPDMDKMISILDKYEIRHKVTDHTDTYLYNPEKVTVLREELDKWMESFVTVDFILERIYEVGIEKISKFEKKYLEKESKNY